MLVNRPLMSQHTCTVVPGPHRGVIPMYADKALEACYHIAVLIKRDLGKVDTLLLNGP